MVKMLGSLVVALVVARVWLLELVAVVLLAVAAGIWWDVPAVLVVIAVACLLKSFEFDVGSARRGGS
jgi:hypothetical protein